MRRIPLGDNAECEQLRSRRNRLNFQISRLHQDQERLSAQIRSIEIRIADKEAELRTLGRDTFDPKPHDPVDADRRRRGRERPKTPWGVVADVVDENIQDLRRRSIERDIRDRRREADPFIRDRMSVTAQRNDLIAERAQTNDDMRRDLPEICRSNRYRIALCASGIGGAWSFKQKPPPDRSGGGSCFSPVSEGRRP